MKTQTEDKVPVKAKWPNLGAAAAAVKKKIG